jgi:hypothetical protein
MVQKQKPNIEFVTNLVSRINADAHNSATQGL